MSFDLVGTPFADPEQASSSSKTEKTKAQKREEAQYVYDEQGRRRFHGAFTGGWSAGYYLSVDTKEGWTPSTFKSSRTDKKDDEQKRPLQKVQDFMDDEDFSEFGIGAKVLSAQSDYVRERDSGADATVKEAIADVIRPVRQSVGVRMLQNMGWRVGKGIGPKSQRAVDAPNVGKSYGCSIGPSSLSFDPNDIESISFHSKNNRKGLDYLGLDPTLCSTERSVGIGAKGRGRKGISGQAFGVGALNEDEDDVDIYAVSDTRSYDFSLGRERSEEQLPNMSDEFVPATGTAHFLRLKQYMPPPMPRGYVPSGPASQTAVPTAAASSALGPSRTPAERSAVFDSESANRTLQANNINTPEPIKSDPDRLRRFGAYVKALKAGEIMPCPSGLTEFEWQRELASFISALPSHLKPDAAESQRKSAGPMAAAARPDLVASFATRFVSKFVSAASEEQVLVSKSEMKLTAETDKLKAVQMDMLGQLTRSRFEWHPHHLLSRRFNIPNPFPMSSLVGIPGHSSKTAPSNSAAEVIPVHGMGLISTSQQKVLQQKPSHFSKTGEAEYYDEQAEPSSSTTPPDVKAVQRDSTDANEAVPVRASIDLFHSVFGASSSEEEDDDDDGDKTSSPPVVAAPRPTVNPHVLAGVTSQLERAAKRSSRWDASPIPEETAPSFSQLDLPEQIKHNDHDETKPNVELRPITLSSDDETDASYGPALPPGLNDDDDDVTVLKTCGSEHTSAKESWHKKKSHKTKKKKKHKSKHSPY